MQTICIFFTKKIVDISQRPQLKIIMTPQCLVFFTIFASQEFVNLCHFFTLGLRFLQFYASPFYFKETLYGSPPYNSAIFLTSSSNLQSARITTITLFIRISTKRYGVCFINISYLYRWALLSSGNTEPIHLHSDNFIGFSQRPDISGRERISEYISPKVCFFFAIIICNKK